MTNCIFGDNSDERKSLVSRYFKFKTQLGHVAKNATLGYPARNRNRDLANLVRYSAN